MGAQLNNWIEQEFRWWLRRPGKRRAMNWMVAHDHNLSSRVPHDLRNDQQVAAVVDNLRLGAARSLDYREFDHKADSGEVLAASFGQRIHSWPLKR